ncbi:hypothetical protein F4775DRAFT_591154 [Biscogniauxia sp. FL1348]|nr:hypothetical protein F4775DRAFT_591154 [Biscogniauxia sp. FL1348]
MASNSEEEFEGLRRAHDNNLTAAYPLVVNGSNPQRGSTFHQNTQSTIPCRSQDTDSYNIDVDSRSRVPADQWSAEPAKSQDTDAQTQVHSPSAYVHPSPTKPEESCFICQYMEYTNTNPNPVQPKYEYGTSHAIPSTQGSRMADDSSHGYTLGQDFQQPFDQQGRFESPIQPCSSTGYTFGQVMHMPVTFGYYAVPAVMIRECPSTQAPAPAPNPRSEVQELRASMTEVRADLEETKRLAADVRDELKDILILARLSPSELVSTATTTTIATNDVPATINATKLAKTTSYILHHLAIIFNRLQRRLRVMGLAMSRDGADKDEDDDEDVEEKEKVVDFMREWRLKIEKIGNGRMKIEELRVQRQEEQAVKEGNND